MELIYDLFVRNCNLYDLFVRKSSINTGTKVDGPRLDAVV
jgi:hypothetical protein